MQTWDFHVHSTFSDGRCTPEEMVEEAIRRGMTAIGFSDHSYTSCDESYCMKRDRVPAYKAEINRLKEKYKDRIRVCLGIEQDFYGDDLPEGYDYVIGGIHYIKGGDEYYPVDHTTDILRECADKHFGGDIYSLCEEYFRCAGLLAEKTRCTIVGHFDLVTKRVELEDILDVHNPRYIAAWKGACDRLLEAGVTFEINTGAISRGSRTTPYPSEEIRTYLRARGAELIFSSDSHKKENLCFQFDQWY